MGALPGSKWILVILFQGVIFAVSAFAGSHEQELPFSTTGFLIIFSGELAGDIARIGISSLLTPASDSGQAPVLTVSLDHSKSVELMKCYNNFADNFFEYQWPSVAQIIMLGVQMFRKKVEQLSVTLIPGADGKNTDLHIALNYLNKDHLHWKVTLPGLDMRAPVGTDSFSQSVVILTPLFLELVSLVWFNAEVETPLSSCLSLGDTEYCEFTQYINWSPDNTPAVQPQFCERYGYFINRNNYEYFWHYFNKQNNLLLVRKIFADQAIQRYLCQLQRADRSLQQFEDTGLSVNATCVYCGSIIPLASFCQPATSDKGLAHYLVSYAEVAYIDASAQAIKFVDEHSFRKGEHSTTAIGVEVHSSVSSPSRPTAPAFLVKKLVSPNDKCLQSLLSESSVDDSERQPASCKPPYPGKENRFNIKQALPVNDVSKDKLAQEFLDLKNKEDMQDRYRGLFALAQKSDIEDTLFHVSDDLNNPEPPVERCVESEKSQRARQRRAQNRVEWRQMECYAKRKLKNREEFTVQAVEVPSGQKAGLNLGSYLTAFKNQPHKKFLLKGRLIFIQQANQAVEANVVFDDNILEVTENGGSFWEATLRVTQDIPSGTPIKMKFR